MEIKKVTPNLSVSGQVQLSDVQAIATQGFRTLICNRPDGESPDQPAFEDVAAAARDHGLQIHFLPAITGQVTDAQAAAFGDLLASAPSPVLAYCRSGMRSITLWALSEARRQPAAALLEIAMRAGYDLSSVVRRPGA